MTGALSQSAIDTPGAGADALRGLGEEEGATLGRLEPEIDFVALGEDALSEMVAAGYEVRECERVLRKANLNVVGEVLKHQGEFVTLQHYPKGDVYDRETHAQFYYHAHRQETGEHGHFHTFLRKKGMPEGVAPAERAHAVDWPSGDDALTHFVALSCNAKGGLRGLFTTNRWVTAETWYEGEDVIAMLDRFEIDHAYPSWPTNRWVSGVLRLFRPQIEMLIRERDKTIAEWKTEREDGDPLEDRALEITSICDVSIEEQLARVEAALEELEAS